jgi:transaldolase / glucose-6-phosphate isomerase
MNPQTGSSATTSEKTANPLLELRKQGQSVWLDYIRRSLLTSGELKRLAETDGVSGVTSNPTIFDKAIAGSNDYDAALEALLARDPRSAPAALFESLAIEDIRMAADILRPVWERASGADGFVSLEVAPGLAHDTEGSVREARRLWEAVSRPNLMIKIPATREGIPAVEQLLSEGINVNITLMFSRAHYENVAHAYLRGLARCENPERLASVASFFVSRVDTLIDKQLEAIATPEARALLGTIAIANSKAVYRRFREIFYGEPFAPFRSRGARVQRVLWASTSTKNPAYSDVLYLEELVGPDTVNTVPPATLKAFRDHGSVRGSTVEEDFAGAESRLERLAALKIALNQVGETLSQEGVALFAESFDQLMKTLEEKRGTLLAGKVDRQTISAGPVSQAAAARIQSWQEAGFARRLWEKDYTLWSPKPVPEIADRMGWLHLPESMHEQIGALAEFREEIRREGFRDVVLLGMGGSSLAPDVFARTFGNAPGYPRLTVLDSTHPAAVRGVEAAIDLPHALFLVSSKSGTTTEMLSFFYYFWQRAGEKNPNRGRQFVAITDPGTPLERLAKERGFRRVFQATPDVGGRYSALTFFGLVPAALLGLDLGRLLDRAWEMAEACAFCVPAAENPGLQLGALLGEAALAGRDKVTFLASAPAAALPTWLEQLIAESTGKSGKGIVPVADEPPGAPAAYGNDRVFVHFALGSDGEAEKLLGALESAGHPVVRIRLAETADIAQEFFRWEIAVPAAGALLGIHPFNQPDVQLAKELAREAMKAGGASGKASAEAAPVSASRPDDLGKAFAAWLGGARPGDYIGLQAYLPPSAETTAALENLRLALRDRMRLATTFGYGPRFLHSTGQLHKGGANNGLFLQLVDDASPDLAVPETDYSFGALIRAQALGDYQALRQRNRRVLRVQVSPDVRAALARLEEAAHG